MLDGSIITAYSNPGDEAFAPANMVKGPKDTIIVANRLLLEHQEVYLFDTSSTEFTLKEVIQTGVEPRTICYHDTDSTGAGLIIVSDPFRGKISATDLRNKQLIWRLDGVVQDKMIKANCMRSGPSGQLFVADGVNQRIVTVEGSIGLVLQVIELPELGSIYGVEA